MADESETCVVQTNRGLDEHGIPAALFLATVKGLNDKGHEVGVCNADSHAVLDTSSDDAFYGALLQGPPRSLTLTVAGPRAQCLAAAFIALVDECSADILREVGMAVLGPVEVSGQLRVPPGLVGQEGIFWILEDENEWPVCLTTEDATQRLLRLTEVRVVCVDGDPSARAIWVNVARHHVLHDWVLGERAAILEEATPDGNGAELWQIQADSGMAWCWMEVRNELGIHGKPTALMVQLAQRYLSESCRMLMSCRGTLTDLCSVMALLLTALSHGARFLVLAEGNDAQEAVEAMRGLVQNRFGED